MSRRHVRSAHPLTTRPFSSLLVLQLLSTAFCVPEASAGIAEHRRALIQGLLEQKQGLFQLRQGTIHERHGLLQQGERPEASSEEVHAARSRRQLQQQKQQKQQQQQPPQQQQQQQTHQPQQQQQQRQQQQQQQDWAAGGEPLLGQVAKFQKELTGDLQDTGQKVQDGTPGPDSQHREDQGQPQIRGTQGGDQAQNQGRAETRQVVFSDEGQMTEAKILHERVMDMIEHHGGPERSTHHLPTLEIMHLQQQQQQQQHQQEQRQEQRREQPGTGDPDVDKTAVASQLPGTAAGRPASASGTEQGENASAFHGSGVATDPTNTADSTNNHSREIVLERTREIVLRPTLHPLTDQLGDGKAKGQWVDSEGGQGWGSTDKHFPFETRLWVPDITFSKLETVDMRYFQGLRCKGGGCPDFQPCSSPMKTAPISACWNDHLVDDKPIATAPPLNVASHVEASRETRAAAGDGTGSQGSKRAGEDDEDLQEGEPFSGQMFLLENVFLNDRGSILDATFHYRHALFCKSCPLDYGSYVGNETVVTVFDELLTLAYWNGANFYHAMLEVMPDLLVAESLLAAHPRMPVAVRMLQDMHGHVFDLIGRPMETLNLFVLPDNQLFFARRLYVPAQAQCARPSRAALVHMRANYLVPPWPLLLRSPAAVSDDPSIVARAALAGGQWKNPHKAPGQKQNGTRSEGGGAGGDWLVAVGRREGTRRIKGREHLLHAVYSLFPRHRVVIFDGNMTIQASRDLFNSVRLFITPHGALMTNMMFMPQGGHVLEVRPRGFNNGCYHYLAHVIGLKYYLVKGDGSKNTDIRVDMEELLSVVRHISKSLHNATT